MSNDYCEFPPINPAIFAEIADLLPDGHLKTYWVGLTGIQKLPKEDPIVVAVLSMGIMTLVARQVPEELAKLLRELKEVLHQSEVRSNVKAQCDQIETARKDAAREIIKFSAVLENAKRSINRSMGDIDAITDKRVKEAIRSSSSFSKHPLAAPVVGGGLVVLGILLEYLVARYL